MREKLLATLLVCASTAITLLLLEAGVRIFESEYGWGNFREQKITLFRSAYPAAHDAELGWIPKPGTRGNQNIWRTQVSILDYGIRANGADGKLPSPAGPPPILAVGDSFTFGDQVSDAESWPAWLQQLSSHPVLNGGVFSYGIDQSYLRAKQLVERFHPKILIFGFIAEDIDRCRLSERNAVAKPYFTLENDRLALHNTPVPPPPERSSATTWKDVLGHSYLAHKVMMKAFKSYWLQGDWWRDTPAHEQGDAVACKVLQALEQFSAARGVRLYLLMQYKRDDIHEARVLDQYRRLRACLQPGTAVIDLQAGLAAEQQRDADGYKSLFKGHMTAQGNRWVAEQVWRVVSKDVGH
ncbi:MAG: hypothetical protein EPN21_00050 [Methylococcaceae bacterium]|nr:MAG: hypothetical protein EPN21_00050 [Methylococcaceae bacterium]